MNNVFITGTGVWTPQAVITNDELVASFNDYVQLENSRNAEAIAAGAATPLQPSSSEFIEKASGIRQRHVIDKSGILDPHRMCPDIPSRPNEQISLMAEMAVAAAKDALHGKHYVTVMAEDGLPAALKAVFAALIFAIGVFGVVLMLWGYIGAGRGQSESPESEAPAANASR